MSGSLFWGVMQSPYIGMILCANQAIFIRLAPTKIAARLMDA
jgi:hypothetical protein